MKSDTVPSSVEAVFDLRSLAPEQLAQLGVPDMAYIKPVFMNGAAAFAIHAADGSPMAVAVERDLAIAAVVQHEMLPALVH
ncbi:MAG: DUF1150 family protein [Acetobacteraceae bacterium]|nr:DUF1150 family protein [Acetobacteraceae bacterium]